MIYIFCDSDNGVTTPGTLYQTSAAWPANSDRWSSIASAIANTTIQGLADDLTFLVQGANNFAAFNTAALTAALSVLVEGDATGAVWDDSKATCSGSAGGGVATLALAVPQTVRNIQLINGLSTGTPRGVFCIGTGACILDGLKVKFTGVTLNAGGAGVTATTAAAVTVQNCIFDVISPNSNTTAAGINLTSTSVGNFYNCVFRGRAGQANTPDNCVNCVFFEFSSIGASSSGNYKNCVTVTGTGTNPVTVSDFALVFQDYERFDYRLRANSPLIGAGIGPTADAAVPTTDIAGNTRSGSTTTVGATMYVPIGQRAIKQSNRIASAPATMAGAGANA
jgi:hypothetical protein